MPVESVFNAEMVRAKLGLTLESRTLQFSGGNVSVLMITSVEKNSLAEAQGLRNGVFVIAVDDELPENIPALAKRLYEKKKGDTLQLRLLAMQQDAGIVMYTWRLNLPVR